jgi:predicted enzyme related to lactoylglutathione lyase
MSDALDALRVPAVPADPDPAFAARLRARVERALDLPRGVSMNTPSPTLTRPEQAAADPVHAGAAIPYLMVADARAALGWYADVLGARPVGDPYVMSDGRIGHAELALGDGMLYLAEGGHPELGVAAADPAATVSSVSLVLRVGSVDAVLAAARAAGARVVREPYEGYGSRNATIFDPFGHRWMLMQPQPAEPVAPFRYRHGDTAYVSLWVPDVERAAAFFATVLGWDAVGSGPGRQVPDTTPPQGMWTVDGPPSFMCCYAVDDIASALDRVTRGGGEAGETSVEPYGTVAMCSDDQGARFALVELPAGPAAGDPPPHGVRAGDIAYVSMETPDSAAARAFYGSVLGWEYSGGRSSDGWNVERAAPMTGLGGGAARPAVRPMFLVDDIDAAVQRVRAAGGTSTDAARRPYGLEADCVDDQGTRFYLGLLSGVDA